MATAFVGIGDLIRDLGLSAAAVQARQISQQQKSNLFWLNCTLGLGFAVICIAGAPAIASLFQDPRLVAVIQALSFTYLLNGIQTQSQAELGRSLRFRTLALSDLLAFVVGALSACGFALMGFGYWALVLQFISQAMTLCIVRVTAARWSPSMPSWRTPMGGLLRFGLFATLVQIVAYVGNNAHNVILGRSYDASQLGYYSRAYQLYMVPTIQVLGPLTSVAHPLLSRMQDDHRSLAKTLPTLGSILGYPIALLCAVIAAAPNPVVQVLLGSQWAESANILGILSIGGAVLGLNRVLVWCHQALGLNRQLFVSFLLSRTLMVSGMWMAADDGLDSVAVAFTAMVVISWPMNSYALHARGVLDHRYWLVSIRILLLATMLFLAARTCAILTEDLSAIAQLFAISLSAVAVTLVAGIARPFRRDFQTILSVLR